jgi:hypothetical protein
MIFSTNEKMRFIKISIMNHDVDYNCYNLLWHGMSSSWEIELLLVVKVNGIFDCLNPHHKYILTIFFKWDILPKNGQVVTSLVQKWGAIQ